MELADKDIERIEDYLLGKLSHKDKEAIEQRMKEDSEFAEEVDFMRSLIAASREKGEDRFEDLKKEMGLGEVDSERNPHEREAQQKKQPYQRRVLHPRLLIIVIAATILTAILLIVL
jgi:anti-sigma-K factor RskA